MTGYVMAATDADGERLGERTLSTAPTPAEAAAFGDSHRTTYVSVRHDHDITLYGKDPGGSWSVLVADAPAPVVVELRRRHHAVHGSAPHARPFAEEPDPDGDYVLTAVDVDGEPFGEQLSRTEPTPAEAAAFGDLHDADYVVTAREDADAVTLHGRYADGAWSVIAAGVDVATAEEICLWFDLVQHYRGRSPADGDAGGRAGHPLDRVPAPEGGRMPAERAVALVVERIRARRLDYPTQGLAADRFEAGWSVYAPVDVDESDPMAFLDMPVGRSVFLVSDLGRIKEMSSSVPPRQAEELFGAEEAYVRRGIAEERYMADFRDEVMRLDSASEGSAGIGSFTVGEPTQDMVAARASGLVGPIAQQLALLGPPEWDRLEAVFSFTVPGEIAQLRFRSGNRTTDARVPEQTAVLVRRQRHLAARMPAGPWWRLLLTVTRGAAGAQVATDYDYGDRRFPDDHLLPPAHYRVDLAAYPRAATPAWLSDYVAGAGESGTAARTDPGSPVPAGRSGSPDTRPAPAPHLAHAAGPDRTERIPVLDTTIGWTHLHADPQVITYGRKSIALDEVEWVSYTATRIAEKRFLFPTFYNNVWEFRVGRYPQPGSPRVTVRLSRAGRHAEQPQEWVFLVNLAGQYLEPRLLADLVGRVRRGETVTVGGKVNVNEHGIACGRPRLSLPWQSIGATRVNNGMVRIHQEGVEKPVLGVPLSEPNAALIPDLFAALRP